MIESFKIENYRRFKSFKLSKLGRVNLLVGENNSGKTSILEAIHLFSSHDFNSLLGVLYYRNEFLWINDDTGTLQGRFRKMPEQKFNITNLFYNNINIIDSYFSLIGDINNQQHELKAFVSEIDPNTETVNNQQLTLDVISSTNILVKNIILSLQWKNLSSNYIENTLKLEIDNEGFLSNRVRNFWGINSLTKSNLITPFYQNIQRLVDIFDEISLTDNEDIIINILQIIEPKIKRIATAKNQRDSKGSFKVSLKDSDKPVLMGSMGDGMWQLLTIALAMVNTQNGVLLIDEIDTGLHFTTLLKMWELILETSKKLNVQVFATTHNSDCWMALGELIAKKNEEENNNYIAENEITLHRIEADKNESILFDAEGIVIAKDNDIEVR